MTRCPRVLGKPVWRYLEVERPFDATPESTALFLSAESVKSRRPNGRLSGRSVNTILERIGQLHDAEHTEPERHISPLRPHDLRHTFAFQLAQATNAYPYELERRLGHRPQRYIARYTNPPEHVAAGYIERMSGQRLLRRISAEFFSVSLPILRDSDPTPPDQVPPKGRSSPR